jgi:hypothetical protein
MVKPCAMEMVKLMCSKDAKLNTAHPIIKLMPFMIELDMSEAICWQVVQRIKKSRKKLVCSWMSLLMSQNALNFYLLKL